MILTNPQLTDYHFEPEEKILLFKRPNIPLDRALLSPLAAIKEVSLREEVPKTEKKKKKLSPDASKLAESKEGLDDGSLVRDFKNAKPLPFP